MAAFSEDFLNEDDIEAVLATFCCYDSGVNASEAVKNIIRYQSKRLSQILLGCYI